MKPALRSRLASRLQHVWYNNETTPPWLLRALSKVYAKVSAAKLTRPQQEPPCPVIVVGNITAGGSGKTPVVAAIASFLQSAGLTPAIISRGYGGNAADKPLRVRPTTAVFECGDEARMLAMQTGLPVWVCKQRAEALTAAIREGADVVISDDGMQHVALARSYEICLIDHKRGFGNGWLLPAGPLRQSTDRLNSVDAKLFKLASDQAGPEGEWSFQLQAAGWHALHNHALSNQRINVSPDLKQEYDAVAGIADPESFFVLLEQQGMRIRRHPLIDHEPLDSSWLANLPGPIVMTAKDAARLNPAVVRSDCFVLNVEAKLPAQLLEQITEHVRKFNT